MKQAAYEALKKALQKLEKAIAKAAVAAVRESPSLQKRVEALHEASETGGSRDDYIDLLAGRSAVQLLLRTVYVRVLEDLGLLDPPRIRGDRGYQTFHDVAPSLGVRAYLTWVFRDLAEDFPALFTPLPDELPLPKEDLCKEVWELWHQRDGKGDLVYDWSAGDFDGRFLGDLYQDLDGDVRERYALLQTPDFVEEYILDQTLVPALAELDPEALANKGEALRVLDPTCGSGHFLTGAFRRMADYWSERGLTPWDASVKALASVWGCDINPYAVDVARFRLLLEVMTRTGVKDMEELSKLVLNLRALDSLIPWEGPRGQGAQGELFEAQGRLSKYATEEERAENAAFLKRAFHVVVGNPPYVTPKDPKKRDDYRVFWPASATGGYGLAAPFCERFFSLGANGAFVGQITGNAFIKREFGVSLVEEVLPRWDLTDIIDTSGAYIPGHGTPTVILIGRARAPVSETIRCVGGKRGEPRAPEVAAEGKVWKAIAAAGQEASDESPFVTVSLYDRAQFAEHPWNLNGGGAPELQLLIAASDKAPLAQYVSVVGFGAVTRMDEVFVLESGSQQRWMTAEGAVQFYVGGEAVRDWAVDISELVLFPYSRHGTVEPNALGKYFDVLWRFRAQLWLRRGKGFKTKKESGGQFYEFSMFYPDRHFSDYRITLAFVSTHNHFVLDRGGKVFNRTAPVIKLSASATLDDHLDLLGLLNSSTLGFWMKQVFFDKGNGGIGGGISNEEWERRFEYDSTKLEKTPITPTDRAARIALASALDTLAAERTTCLPAAVLASSAWAADTITDQLDAAKARYQTLTHRMVALQEELDWLTYRSYGLLMGHEVASPNDVEPLAPGHRPFEILLARHNASCDPEERSEWFARHGHAETTVIPEHYSQATRDRITERLRIIASNKEVKLIEQPQFKRRWQLASFEEETREAARHWLLDRLEDLFAPPREDKEQGPLHTPQPYRLEEIVLPLTRGDLGARAHAVAKVLNPAVDLATVVEALLREHAIPDNPYRVYTADGLRKLDKWKAVWALQDREDAGEKVKIPEPPEYTKDDFTQPRSFQIRGKLNVPRERFLLFADVSPQRYGWNGWRDRERALAQVEAFSMAERHPTDPQPLPTLDDPRRCGATLGLWESLPDVKRWGDPSTREGDYGELHALAEESCQKKSCPCEVVKAWQRSKDEKRKPSVSGETPSAAPAEATVEERAALIALLDTAGSAGATTADLAKVWSGPADRLAIVLDDLMASGHVAGKGRGKARRYSARPPAEPQQQLFETGTLVRGKRKKS